MTLRERARAMRGEGNSFARIAKELGVGLQWAYKLAGDVLGDESKATRNSVIRPVSPKETSATIVRHHAYNGGCSTLSGCIAISMPRIKALHGAA